MRVFFDAAPLLAITRTENSVLCIVRTNQIWADRILSKSLTQIAEKSRSRGFKPSLLVMGQEIDRNLSYKFDHLFVCRDTLVNGKLQPEIGKKQLLGLLASFSNVISFGTTEYAADLNQLRRYSIGLHHVYARQADASKLPNTDLINCFKVYNTVICNSDEDCYRVSSLGVSSEQIIRGSDSVSSKLQSGTVNDVTPTF